MECQGLVTCFLSLASLPRLSLCLLREAADLDGDDRERVLREQERLEGGAVAHRRRERAQQVAPRLRTVGRMSLLAGPRTLRYGEVQGFGC